MANRSRSSMRKWAANDRAIIADRLHSAAIHLLRRVRRSDRDSPIGPARLSALSVLVFGGSSTLQALADTEQVRAPTMTRLVQAMEADGYVRRDPDPDDRRALRLRATAKARRVLERARKQRIAATLALMAGLSRAEVRTLASAAGIIEAMVQGVDKH